MKNLLTFLFLLNVSFSYAQSLIKEDSIPEPIYDTTTALQIKITSKNSFYFCSNKFRVPKDTLIDGITWTGYYSSTIFKTKLRDGLISDGFVSLGHISLSWKYYETSEDAKRQFENYPVQMKRQMKKIKMDKLKLLVCNQEVEAIKIYRRSYDGSYSNEIIFHGIINGKNVFGNLSRYKNELKTSEQIPTLFKQIMKF